MSARVCGYPWEVVSGAGGCGCRAYGARDVAWCWGRVVVGVRMPTRTLGLGFCMLGYPARLERLGLVSPVVGIHVVAPKLVLELVRLLVLVFKLPELVYLTVDKTRSPLWTDLRKPTKLADSLRH